MKATNSMIHKDVRLIGSVLRHFTKGTTASKLYKTQAGTEKKAGKYRAKQSDMEKVHLKREDGSEQRMVILKPKRSYERVPAA